MVSPKLRKTKYEERALTIRDKNGKPMSLPDPQKETILEFIQRAGYSLRDLEGGTPLPLKKTKVKLIIIQKIKYKKNINIITYNSSS